jgi:predicted dinucleotide-binding enzyme
VYYTRTSAAADENRVVQAFEINNAFEVSDTPDSEGYNVCHITITGDEAKTQIDVNDINQPYTIVNSAES